MPSLDSESVMLRYHGVSLVDRELQPPKITVSDSVHITRGIVAVLILQV
jgi:hypothetical protein